MSKAAANPNWNRITSETERQRVFMELVNKQIPIVGIVSNGPTFSFKPKTIEKDQLIMFLQGPTSREPIPGESITLTFGIASGQYYIQTQLEVGRGHIFSVPLSENLMRAQRRRHFRATVPKKMKAEFQVSLLNDQQKQMKFRLFDLSGSGMSILVAISPQTPNLNPGDILEGALHVKDRLPMTLKSIVRHVVPGPEGFNKIGLEFQNLDPGQEQALVVMSLQIYRLTSPSLFQDEA